jgi:O-methyltransferase
MSFPITEKLITQYPVPIFSSSPSKMYHVLKELETILLSGIEGDIVELGCETGQTSIYIRRMLDAYDEKRNYHIYDSWEGVPELNQFDQCEQPFKKGDCKSGLSVFKERFKENNLSMPIIHTGWFGNIPDDEYPNKIAFAFFDGDLYTSIIDSFNKVYHKLVPKARVIIDDYKWFRLPGVEKACNDFLKDKPEKEIFLPDYRAKGEGGGALLIKSECKEENKILLLYTSHRQLEEVFLQSLLYQKYPGNYTDIKNVDILFYCNSTQIDQGKLVEYLNLLPQVNKRLIYTDKNIGYLWGGHEAVAETFDIWKDYSVCVHLHPDIFILRDNDLNKMIKEMKTDFITTYNTDPRKDPNLKAFDFFIFKPKEILRKIMSKDKNFFNLYLDESERNKVKIPENLLARIIEKNNLTSTIIDRYDNNHWEPRRPDMIGLYHEHDLNKIVDIINNKIENKVENKVENKIENKIVDTITPVFINIERFEERRKHCIDLFTYLFPEQFYMFNGVDGKYVNIYESSCVPSQINLTKQVLVEYNDQYFIHDPKYRKTKMSYGEFGCYLSHLKLFDYIIDNNIKYMFITEDDILPTSHIQHFNQYIENLPDDFDICLFHHSPSMFVDKKSGKNEEKEPFINTNEKVNDYYYKVEIDKEIQSHIFTQALSYIVSYRGATKFLTRVKSNIHVPFDDQLARLGLNIIYSKEVLFYQNPKIIKSSIWNIYKEEEDYENVKWDKEIVKESVKNMLTHFSLPKKN